ncbi:ABC transporter permease [Streptomyces sp. JJ38]|uniref:ABC transporter permease n=1 Tax=Streptomyces sp. JJ38 TaxID=2738128 RepID=UPI001C5A36A3|nr:ABC transporter permease [Streptomyces sp. JJ38]MBW1596576.1 ABC transporter permease subunit [Streptomyces sp. JJ38]
MRDLLKAEWLKAWSGRTWWIMAVVALFMGLLGSSGAAAVGDQQLDEGVTDAAAVTAEMVRAWFSALLGSLLFGAVFVSREYGSGAVNRSALLCGGRTRLFTAKAAVGTAMGALFALVAAALAPASAYAFAGLFGFDVVWSGEASRTLLGVATVVVLAAPWGVMLGWLIRNQAATVAIALVLTLFVDETLFLLLPEVGRFTMQVAMGSVYLDGKEDALPVPFALAVIGGWLALAGFLARRRLVSRDIA